MEDSHIAQTDIPPPPFANTTAHAKVFAVFDGHGGAEVARFCQLYMIDVLTHQDQWNATAGKVNVGEALVRCFHALDRLVDSAERRYVLFIFIRIESILVADLRIKFKFNSFRFFNFLFYFQNDLIHFSNHQGGNQQPSD